MQKILVLLALIVLCACSLQSVDPGKSSTELVLSPEPVINLASLCQQKGYTWNSDSTCTYQEANEDYEIRIAYPIEIMPQPLIENAIDSYIADYRADFLQQVEEGEQIPPAAPWFFEMKYNVYHHSPSILSLQISELFFLGGPHHNITLESFTFDLTENRILAFEDLFVEGVDVLAVIQPLARSAIAETMNARGMATPIDESDMQIVMGTDELNDFRNFALTETHLLLSFEAYQVAAYVMGQQDIQIPLSALAGVLRDF